MKTVIILVFFLFSLIGLGQNTNNEIYPETIVPQLFQFDFPNVQTIQRVPSQDVYLTPKNWSKYGKKTWDILTNFEVKYKNKDVFFGKLDKDGDRFQTRGYFLYKGTMKFHNGDVFVGEFHDGAPESGEYTFANGDKASLSKTGQWQSHQVLYKYTLINGDKYEWNTEKNTGIYYYADGSVYNYSYGLSGGTSLQTKEGYLYKGNLDKKKPVGKWTIKDAKGSYFVFFEKDGFGGFVPFNNEDKTISWKYFENNKFVKDVKLLSTGCFCITGDCVNGEGVFYVGEDPEYKLNAIFGGKFKNGVPMEDFVAVLIDNEGNKKYEIIGPVKDYKFHGKCTKTFLDKKNAFTGEYRNGLPQSGNLTIDGKLIEIQSFKDGKFIGKQTFPRENEYQNNSRYYEGEFNQYGQIDGKGTVYFETGYKLESPNWSNGNSSNCTFTTPNNYSENDFYCNIYGGSYFRSLGNQKELEYYAAKSAQEEQAKQKEIANHVQSEHQCGQCNGLGVIKIQCPTCKGAGYRKDMITYDKYTGNTGGSPKCSHCGGTGQYTVMGCSKCSGKGYVKK